jgi:hypothetical protein
MAKIGTYPSSGGDDNAPIPTTGAPLVAPAVAFGQVAAPGAAVVIADSGALPAGIYMAEITLGYSAVAAAGKHISVEHRNAANAANIAQLGLCPGGGQVAFKIARVVLAANERIRAVGGAVVGAAGEVAHATIRTYLLPQ